MKDLDKIINFLNLIEKLKTIERFNKTSNLARAESDAEHIWHLIMLVYLLSRAKPLINKYRAIELALVHDLVEVYAGDVNFWDPGKKRKAQKLIDEKKAIKKLFSKLPKKEKELFLSFWEEYETRQTSESKFVYALDKIQPFMQRLISRDNGWKERGVTRDKLRKIKPKEVKEEPFLSNLWDSFIKQAVEKNLLSKNK